MKTEHRKYLLLFVIIVIIFSLAVSFVLYSGTKDEKVNIGLVMTGQTDEIGWNSLHYTGVSEACKELDVNLIVKEDIKENTGACKQAVKELADADVSMIILSSYNYPNEIEEEFEKYSDIVFYSISSETDAENCISYFGRLYQVRYLSGLIAGSVTETNNIGYVANTPNNEINRGINAFTLGVKAVNPKARVIVKWVGSWDDKQAETDAVNSLIEEYNIDLVTHHQNQNYVVEAAEKAGIYSIGNNGISGEYSEKYLTSVGWNWLELYKKIIREFIHDKSDKDVNHWFGIETGAVVLSELSEAVDEETRALVSSAEEKIKSGKDVFSGVIYDNNGNQQCDTEEIITDETLLNNMDWFVEGVEIYE